MLVHTDERENDQFFYTRVRRVRDIASRIRTKHMKNLIQKNKYESIKYAISAIMSRNMSHNLGSHYLYYTKNQLASLANKMSEHGPEIRGAAKVLGYLQARMDYLATIVAGDKYPYGGVFLKGQIYDELTIDDFSQRHYSGTADVQKRTTNYLLQNLINSENFTRPPVDNDIISANNNPNIKEDKKLIKLQVRIEGQLFTGTKDNSYEERDIKALFAKYSVALPGGVMSIHAFFNVVENLIRNSAKYMKEDFQDELVITIAVKRKAAVKDRFPECYEFVIYDNKNNAMRRILSKSYDEHSTMLPLFKLMNTKLKQLKILNSDNALEKSDKGIKEMLFSILWMRAYTYKIQSFADVLMDIDNKELEEKFKEIRYHAFEYVAVDDGGIVVAKDNTEESMMPSQAHLGIRFYLPVYRKMELQDTDSLKDNIVEIGLNNFTDMICVKGDFEPLVVGNDKKAIESIFTRVYRDRHHEVNEVNVNNVQMSLKALTTILNERFGNINEYKLFTEGFDGIDAATHGIYFQSHLGENNNDFGKMRGYAYSEAVSGGNFTKTIQVLLESGVDENGEYIDDESRYFALKVKESALTRITLIDERFYNEMVSKDKMDFVMQCKNIRLLNLKSTIEKSDVCTVKQWFDGNDFRDGSDATHFLSIHLGLIEKIVDDKDWCQAFGLLGKNSDIRTKEFMAFLRDRFHTDKGEVFITIHSGRGNFSKDLDGPLQDYPFLSISAIENVLVDSKFLLSELFYNTVYIGKGRANQ